MKTLSEHSLDDLMLLAIALGLRQKLDRYILYQQLVARKGSPTELKHLMTEQIDLLLKELKIITISM